jgi:DNA-binding protein H-NS
MSTTADIQSQIERAEAQVRELREKLKAQHAEERHKAISDIKALVKLHQLSAAELGLSAGTGRKGRSGMKSAHAGTKVAAKYRDPATGNTWTGRGKTPTWLAKLMASGRKREEFAV